MEITIDPTVGEQKSQTPYRLLYSPKNKGQKGGQGSYNFNIPCYFQRGSSFEIKHH